MLESLKEFIATLTEDGPSRDGDRLGADCRLAAAALLFHVADIDGAVDPLETAKLRAIISDRFGLDAAQTTRLIAEARVVDHEAVDLYHFTSVLNRALDHAGRLKVIEMMWEMAYADGKLDELEETTLWRVAELMGVSTRERVGLRQKVAERAPQQADEAAEPASPWGPREEA